MKSKLFVSLLIAAALGALVANQAVSGDTKKQTEKSQEEMMQAWQKFMTPTEHHQYLKSMVGKWNATVKTWEAPGTEPQVSNGTAEYKMIMGDRYLTEDMQSVMMGMPFSGMGVSGYDNAKQKHFVLWIDNMGTSYSRFEGKCSDNHELETLTGTGTDPITGKDIEYRTVTRVVSNSKHVMEMFMKGADGKEFKIMEITYERI